MGDIADFVSNYANAQNYFENKSLILPEKALTIFVPSNTCVEEPIILSDAQAAIEKIFIILEPGAQLIIHDIRLQSAGKAVRDIFIEIQENAQLTYFYDQATLSDAEELMQCTAEIKENGYFCFVPIDTGAANFRLTCDVQLLGNNARTDITGFYLLQKNQKHEIITQQQHKAKNTQSNLSINGILRDQSYCSYRGNININENAANSIAAQTNKNILFGNQARAVSIPSLEVKVHEVQCKHGSAVGQLNVEDIFYLQSRGLPYQQIKQLLLEAFLKQAFVHLSDSIIEKIHFRMNEFFNE